MAPQPLVIVRTSSAPASTLGGPNAAVVDTSRRLRAVEVMPIFTVAVALWGTLRWWFDVQAVNW